MPAATVAELAAWRPTVLIVEDLHWADDATLDVLGHVGRRLADLPALLVLTYRDDEVPPAHPLRRVLGALTATTVHRLALPPLSPAAVASLAVGSGHDSTALHTLTGGNPFYVTETLAAPGDTVPATPCSPGSAGSTRHAAMRSSSCPWYPRPSSSVWPAGCSARGSTR